MSKVVIGIHGLGNKPPRGLLSEWWKKAILEGLKKSNYSIKDFDFELVYWADILHKKPLDPNETNSESEFYISEPFKPEEAQPDRGEMSFRKKAVEYLEKYSKKILVNGVLSLNIPSLTELFIHRHLRDLEVYYSPSFTLENGNQKLVRQVIIERLIETLKKHGKERIFLIAHSMGSIIAYDALKYYLPKIKIEILVTIGSPLGQEYVIKKIKDESLTRKGEVFMVPENIRIGWYNFADKEDQVAINHNLSKIYKENSRKIRVNDILVHNNYKISETGNPHKSYGYLRTHEFSDVLNSFLTSQRFNFFRWIKNIFQH
ncbi:MAG: hypothetical protein OQK52_00970 [Ignavibacteriaceae bacterium]|nr:hypothetical protein [Chlorobium sp.]MCW8816428.1 hypothetical protein [Ignavibacteriaceae bacterium]MCW8824486.1 hypothetical protein [Ignavibacteriaceae bacterium]